MKKSLILGGARSGKSRLAEERVLANGSYQPIYIATAWGGDKQDADAEMQQRIRHHQQMRDARFCLIEEQLQLSRVLREHDDEGVIFLVDCLTLWLNNCLYHGVWENDWQLQKSPDGDASGLRRICCALTMNSKPVSCRCDR
jgi:adenosylcobinamide kinase/adenosylcobinamide-phosphate guanylyltransferase